MPTIPNEKVIEVIKEKGTNPLFGVEYRKGLPPRVYICQYQQRKTTGSYSLLVELALDLEEEISK